MNLRRLLVTLLVLGNVATAALQQQPPSFASRTAGVRLDVSVFEGPAAISGLTAKNFEVSDNGTRQEFALTETRDAPLDLVLVAQPLASLSQERQSLMQGVMQAFPAWLRDGDRMGIIMATAGPDVLRPLLPIAETLARPPVLTGDEGVTLRDALLRAFLLFDTADRRAVVIAFTDARHDQSWITAAAVEAAALAQPAQVIVAALDATSTVGVSTAYVDPRNGLVHRDSQAFAGQAALTIPSYLASLSKRTGGRVIDLRTREAASRLSELLVYLRSQYVITYAPTTPAPGRHDVSIRLRNARGTVVARDGYWMEGRD